MLAGREALRAVMKMNGQEEKKDGKKRYDCERYEEQVSGATDKLDVDVRAFWICSKEVAKVTCDANSGHDSLATTQKCAKIRGKVFEIAREKPHFLFRLSNKCVF